MKIKLLKRILVLAVAMFTITSVFPTLAEELTPSPISTESPAPDVSPSPDAQPSPTPTATPEPSDPSSIDGTPSPSPSESADAKVKVAKVQPHITYRFPNSVALDPRATVGFLPQISLTGGNIGVVCISSSGVIDVATKNFANNAEEGDLLIAGDLSSHVRLSGSLGSINQLINTSGGVRISAGQSKITNSSVTFSYVELTGLDASSEFCGKTTSSRSIVFRALDLQMDNVKTRVDFNKPSGK